MDGAAYELDRAAAVRIIGDAFADRTSYVVSAHPLAVGSTAQRLAQFPDVAALVDTGADSVLGCEAATAGHVCAMFRVLGVEALAVFLVPKRVPAKLLSKKLDGAALEEGARDMIMVGPNLGNQYHWPTLLLDAIAPHDPKFVASVLATDIARQS